MTKEEKKKLHEITSALFAFANEELKDQINKSEKDDCNSEDAHRNYEPTKDELDFARQMAKNGPFIGTYFDAHTKVGNCASGTISGHLFNEMLALYLDVYDDQSI